MKKYYVMIFCIALLFVTGCGNGKQVACSKTETIEGVSATGTIIGELDANDKVVGASMAYEFADKESATKYCDMMKGLLELSKNLGESTGKASIDCSGSKITIKGFEELEGDDEEDKVIGLSKDEFVQKATEEGYTCK